MNALKNIMECEEIATAAGQLINNVACIFYQAFASFDKRCNQHC